VSDRNQLTNAEKKAFEIYDLILTTSSDRPFSGQTVEQMRRDIANWKAQSPGLKALEQAPDEVLVAFLNHSFEWLKERTRERHRIGIASTLMDATEFALNTLPKPLPTETAARLISKLRADALTRYYFPFPQFLAALTREQITDDMRSDLRSLQLHYAPSPTGKIEKRDAEIRSLISQLILKEGEKPLAPGRGPWSQIVFDEVAGKDDITRLGWEAILKHCTTLEQTVPGGKWRKRTNELIAALGADEVCRALTRWLALGPTPGQPAEARSPAEDSGYQKGVVWALSLYSDGAGAAATGDFAIACLRKIKMLGAVSQKVGFACVQALGAMECSEAISQLSRLRSKVKYSVARRLIEKSLHQAAERAGMTTEDLEDSCVENFGLDAEGKAEISIGDAKARVQVNEDGRVGIAWYNADGKLVKSAPSHIRKAFAKQVKTVAALSKELEQTYSAQRFRIEASLANPRTMSVDHWKIYFVNHPLLGFLGRRLIWIFRNADGSETVALWEASATGPHDSSGAAINLSRAQSVSLWHPLSSNSAEVQRWRDRIFALSVRQPFRQAFREFYTVTSDERKAAMHSNRFAGIVIRQHQLASLCRVRGWNYRLMGSGFDGFNVPSLALPQWNMQVEFYVDIPSDRSPDLHDSGLNDQSGAGINLFVSSDQVRFYRDRREIPLDEVPAVVYSEVMRDVDLFTSGCAVGEDQKWTDQGDRGIGILNDHFDLDEVSGILELRTSILKRVLPHTSIAGRCRLNKSWLEVRGDLGTYQIQLIWSGTVRVATPSPRWINIPRALLDAVSLDLAAIPIELDYRTDLILRKAHVLANDWKIDSPELVRQLFPE